MFVIGESEKRGIARRRSEQLKERIEPYLEAREEIPSGLELEEEIARRRERIISLLDADEKDWNSWRWQLENRIDAPDLLAEIVNLDPGSRAAVEEVGVDYRWAISPYYASLMDGEDRSCPVRMQAIPDRREVEVDCGLEDPMAEEYTSPAPRITRRYADRLIINVTNQCAMFCRHCQRRRRIGSVDRPAPRGEIESALDYIKRNAEIRDVLITGGDPLTLDDEVLDWVLSELDAIPHVEIKRIGSRTPVTMPQRITPGLCEMLAGHHPLYLNTHFNHPLEVTKEAREACMRLARAGIGLGNQAVLLRGINNDPHVMKYLNHQLLQIQVRPYYIFHAKPVKGTTHFVTTVQEGMEIIEQLRGYTSGLAIPTYIVNAPEGHGKTPIEPTYLISMGEDHVLLRTWEGKVFRYPNSSQESVE